MNNFVHPPTADFLRLPPSERVARVRRFDERVSAALQAAPPSRDLVRRATRRQGASRCPVRLRRLSYDIVLRYGDVLADLFCEYPDDTVFVAPYEICIGFQPPERKDRVDPVLALTQDARWTDEWGTTWAHAFGGVGATPVACPLRDWVQLDDYLAHGIPDPNAAGRLDVVQAAVNAYGPRSHVVGMMHLLLFERLHALRGMEALLEDFHAHPNEVRRLLEAVVEYDLALIRQFGGTAIDALFVTDDWGTQTSLMISPTMWRIFFAAAYRRLFDEIHHQGMDVIFHSCGNVAGIISDLIDLGADVIDPLQPEAVDVNEAARRFGSRVAFCGGISDQLLAVYSPSEVRDVVRQTIDTLGKPFGNALIVSPANILTPEIPLENLEALFRACHQQ